MRCVEPTHFAYKARQQTNSKFRICNTDVRANSASAEEYVYFFRFSIFLYRYIINADWLGIICTVKKRTVHSKLWWQQVTKQLVSNAYLWCIWTVPMHYSFGSKTDKLALKIAFTPKVSHAGIQLSPELCNHRKFRPISRLIPNFTATFLGCHRLFWSLTTCSNASISLLAASFST